MAQTPDTPPKARRPLTPKQELFVIEYAKDFNATQAAIRAGYSRHTAAEQGVRLLRKVQPLIEQHKAEVMAKRGTGIANLEQTLKLATARAFYDPAKLYDTHGNPLEIPDIPKFHRRGIAGFDIEELYDGKGENRRKIGYVKRYRLVDSAPYVAMLLKFHGAFPAKKDLPPVPVVRGGGIPWASLSLDEQMKLREELQEVVKRYTSPKVVNG